MLKLIKILFVGATISLTWAGLSVAASFDCSKASTDTEKAICADPQLSKLDDILAELYRLKKTIDYSSMELSKRSDTNNFPKFSRKSTQDEQLAWIENVQKDCYGATNCLVRVYLSRIQDFFDIEGEQETRTWRILTKLDNPGSDYSTLIWIYNNNENDEPGCFGDNFKGVFYIVAIYNKVERKLLAASPSLIDPKESGCLEYEIELIPSKGDEVSLAVGSWMSAGSWGSSTHVYGFKIVNSSVNLASYRYHEYARNVHLFQTKNFDFEKSLLTINLYNGSDETQSIFGVLLKPEDEFVIKKDFNSVEKLDFDAVNETTMYELMDQIQEQLQLQP